MALTGHSPCGGSRMTKAQFTAVFCVAWVQAEHSLVEDEASVHMCARVCVCMCDQQKVFIISFVVSSLSLIMFTCIMTFFLKAN